MNPAVYIMFALWGYCLAHPQQGYGYSPPQPQPPPPANLYETPTRPASPPQRPPPPPPPPQRPPPSPPANNYGAPSVPGPVKVDPPPRQPTPDGPQMEGMPYDFEWGVDDSESGNSFSHVETSDGQRTEGEYRVLLPDGRTQVVKFFDDGNGFNADVSYA